MAYAPVLLAAAGFRPLAQRFTGHRHGCFSVGKSARAQRRIERQNAAAFFAHGSQHADAVGARSPRAGARPFGGEPGRDAPGFAPAGMPGERPAIGPGSFSRVPTSGPENTPAVGRLSTTAT